MADIIEKIVASGKITEEDLRKKIEEKVDSLGSLISEEGAAHIIANELGVTIEAPVASSEIKLNQLSAGLRNLTTVVRVLKKYELRTFGEGGKVGSLFVGDETGFSRLTFWNDKTDYFEKINEQDVVLVQNAYVKENNGRLEIHMGNSSHCIVNPEGKTVTVKERQTAEPETKKLAEIKDDDTFVNITATIVQVYDPRFFESCPQCNKRLRQEGDVFICAEHGKQDPSYNYVMNIFVDDGSANMRAALWKEQVQQLLGKSDSEILALKDDAAAMENTKTDLLGRIITARSRVKLNETFNTKELVIYEVNTNPKAPTVSEEKVEAPKTAETEKKEDFSDELTADNVDEELVTGDEILSIDELDEI